MISESMKSYYENVAKRVIDSSMNNRKMLAIAIVNELARAHERGAEEIRQDLRALLDIRENTSDD